MTTPGDGSVKSLWADVKRRSTIFLLSLAFATSAILATLYLVDRKPDPLTAEILVLGDSQLSFGGGPTLSTFFEDLPNQCRDVATDSSDQELLQDKRFSMIGTRSTSLQSWVTQKGRPWELLCHKDKRWGVNASAWGEVKPDKRRYVQIGEGELFQVCQPDQPPIRHLLAPGYYSPELLMIYVGGNGAARLARKPDLAQRDVDQFIKELPANMG